jgi:hypothetical protein
LPGEGAGGRGPACGAEPVSHIHHTVAEDISP